MGRKILAVIVGFILAFAIFMVFQMISTTTLFMHMSPKNLEYMSAADRAAYFGSMPVGAYVMMLVGYVLGSVAAGWIATKISKERNSMTLPIIVGFLLVLAGLVNFFVVLPGQPVWFIALSLICCIPSAILGHRFAR